MLVICDYSIIIREMGRLFSRCRLEDCYYNLGDVGLGIITGIDCLFRL